MNNKDKGMNLVYVMNNGTIHTRDDINKAFYLTHGYYGKGAHEAEFLKWLYILFKKKIYVKVIPNDRITYEELIKGDCVVYAVRLYREREGTTLMDAKIAIDHMRVRMETED